MSTKATNKHLKKTKKSNKALIITLSSIISFLAIGYVIFGVYFSNRFLPGTKSYGVDISLMTKKEAANKIADQLKGKKIKISDQKNMIAEISKEDLGIFNNYSAATTALMNQQNPWLFSKNDTIKADGSVVVDQKKIADYVASLFPKINENRTVTKNASITNTDGSYKITPEVVGNNFDQATVLKKVTNDIASGKFSIQLADSYVKPTVKKDSEQVKNALETIKQLANTNVTYQLAGNDVVVPKTTVEKWLSYLDGKIVGNQEQIKAYLQTVNSQYATIGKTRKFKSTKRGEVSVPGGTYGWSINIAAEAEKMAQEIVQGNSISREPVIQGAGYHSDGTDIGSTYVEVDLKNQHMWVYQGGKAVISTDIVSGKPNQATPIGVNYVWSKQRNATLRGLNDDGSKYASPVSYWMPIDYTGVGIHDSSWQPRYGGDWYKSNGSHGCINTPPSTMSKVYDTINIGTPVIVF